MVAAQTTNPPTFESVWAALQETDRIVKENARQMKKTDRKWLEEKKETDRKWLEEKKETDRKWLEEKREIDRIVGDLSNRFGEMVEYMVAPSIHKRFNELGYHFDAVAPGGYVIRDENDKVKAEVDILLENAEYIMAVEVKAKVHLKDIEHHIKRIEILREYRNKRADRRKIQGAIAGAIFGNAEKEAAFAAGFYVIEQTGDTVQITNPKDFKARDW
jgi:hypothetical protein